MSETEKSTDSVDLCEEDYKDSEGMNHEEIKKRLLALGESEASAEQLLSDWDGDLDEEAAAAEEEEENC